MLRFAAPALFGMSVMLGLASAHAVGMTAARNSDELNSALSFKFSSARINNICLPTKWGSTPCLDYRVGTTAHETEVLRTPNGFIYSFIVQHAATPIKLQVKTNANDLNISVNILDLSNSVVASADGSCVQSASDGNVLCTLDGGRGQILYQNTVGMFDTDQHYKFFGPPMNAEQKACTRRRFEMLYWDASEKVEFTDFSANSAPSGSH